MASLLLDLQLACDNVSLLPEEKDFISWIEKALPSDDEEYEITLRIVDEAESRALNHQYRNKDKPTNVLSFEFEAPDNIDLPLLGDLVICRQVVEQEAIEQNKTLFHHWAHMCVHGTLHLRGYDHINAEDAEEMENLEINILSQLSISNPYLINE